MKRTIRYKWPLLLAVALGGASSTPVMSQQGQSGPLTPALAPSEGERESQWQRMVQSGTAPNLTLAEAIRLALKNNPVLSAASSQIGSATGRAYQSKLWPNPELELSAEDWQADRGGSFDDTKRMVGASQTLPFPGKKKLEGQIGRLGVRVSEAEYGLRRVELVREVKTAFYEVLAAERLDEVARELVSVAESSAATARKRVEAGAAADQEQLRAEITLEEARTELMGFERGEEMARENLASLLGRPELRGAPLSGALAETVDLGLLEEGPGRWLARHPEVAAARASKERAETEVRRARLEPYPDVKLGAAGGEDSGGGGSIVQFSVSVPVPLIDRSKGKRLETQANVAGATAELAATEQRLLREWGTASQRMRTAAEQAANYRERILPKAKEALRLVQRGFEEGKFGFIDLLDTQRTAAEARLAYEQKLLELNVAQADVEALLARVPGEAGTGRGAQHPTREESD